MRGLAGKVAIVTGASSGIGLATARALVEQGTSVVALARGEDKLAAAIDELAAGSRAGAVIACAGDVGCESAVRSAFETAVEHFGKVDYLCNNAGADGQGLDFADLDEAEWERLLDINIGGAFRFSQGLARHLRQRGAPGAIVNVSSINGFSAERHFADYNTSKGALIALTKSIAIDLAPHIRANVICPGYIETEMTAGYLADPAVRARLADLAQEIFPRVQQTPEALAALQKSEIAKWWPIIKAANVKVD